MSKAYLIIFSHNKKIAKIDAYLDRNKAVNAWSLLATAQSAREGFRKDDPNNFSVVDADMFGHSRLMQWQFKQTEVK